MENLTQYRYLDRDEILEGVCQWIVEESPILQYLPFKEIRGNAYNYNVDLTLPEARWMDFDEPIVTTTGSIAQRTTRIYMILQDGNTPKAIIDTNATQNPEVIDIEQAARAMSRAFETTFIRGQTSTLATPKQFKGLMRMLAELESESTVDLDSENNSQVIANHAASGALTLEKIDELIDAIKPGKPDALLVSRRVNRKITALARASGSGLQMTEPNQFGLRMSLFNTIPILVSDYIPDNLPDGANGVLDIASWDPTRAYGDGYNNSIIFAVQFGEDKVTGLQAGPMKHIRMENLENYHAIKNRFVWLVGAACHKKYSLAALINIDTSA